MELKNQVYFFSISATQQKNLNKIKIQFFIERLTQISIERKKKTGQLKHL